MNSISRKAKNCPRTTAPRPPTWLNRWPEHLPKPLPKCHGDGEYHEQRRQRPHHLDEPTDDRIDPSAAVTGPGPERMPMNSEMSTAVKPTPRLMAVPAIRRLSTSRPYRSSRASGFGSYRPLRSILNPEPAVRVQALDHLHSGWHPAESRARQCHQHEQGNPAGSDAGGKVVGEAIQINGVEEVKLNPAALPLHAAAQKLPPRSPH